MNLPNAYIKVMCCYALFGSIEFDKNELIWTWPNFSEFLFFCWKNIFVFVNCLEKKKTYIYIVEVTLSLIWIYTNLLFVEISQMS